MILDQYENTATTQGLEWLSEEPQITKPYLILLLILMMVNIHGIRSCDEIPHTELQISSKRRPTTIREVATIHRASGIYDFNNAVKMY